MENNFYNWAFDKGIFTTDELSNCFKVVRGTANKFLVDLFKKDMLCIDHLIGKTNKIKVYKLIQF